MYEFDALGRLRNARGGLGAGIGNPTANWQQQYSYDRFGNRFNIAASGMTANSQAVPTDGIPNQSYDSNSNRISTQGYIYDLAGNLVRGQKPDGSWQKFEYDQAGRLTIVRNDATNAVEYGNGYTSSRQRISSFSDSTPGVITYYAWGGSSVIAEFTTNLSNNQTTSVWKKNYIYAGSRLLSTQTNNNQGGETQEFHHPDRLGTKLVTNSQIISQFEQSTLPFGTALDAETTGTTNQRFTSYDRSTVAQLDYAVNRSYSSGQGRFTSPDPIGMSAASLGNPQSLNMYAYVENNPVDFVDPSGLDLASLIYAVGATRELLKFAPCRTLFGNKDPSEELDKVQISISYEYNLIRTNPTTGKVSLSPNKKKFSPPDSNGGVVDGVTYKGIGIVFSEYGTFGDDPLANTGGSGVGSFSVSRSDWLALAVIHELLHYSDAPAPFSHKDFDPAINDQNNLSIFTRCFLLNPEYRNRNGGEVSVVPSNLGTTITPMTIGGVSSGSNDPFRSLEWLLFEQWARGRASVTVSFDETKDKDGKPRKVS